MVLNAEQCASARRRPEYHRRRQAEPVVVKLGVWTSNVRARRDKLSQEQLDALRGMGMEWA